MTGLAMINASSAYARGATGAGVTVGVVDSGVYEEHIEFETNTGDKISLAGSDYASDDARSNDAISHGTLVAGVIAANRDNSNDCLLYTSPSPRDATLSRMPSSA